VYQKTDERLASLAAVTPLRVVRESVSSNDVSSLLGKLLHSRLRRCLLLLPKVLGEDDVGPVHDLRVWSRRLQQVIGALFPNEGEVEAREMMRALRRARRSLGGWRNCDVVISIVDRKLRRVRNSEERRGWEMVRQFASNRRERYMSRARSKIANRRLFTMAQRCRVLLERRSVSSPGNADLLVKIVSSVNAAHNKWVEALTQARSSFAERELHRFRIETKRLRYRIELLRDLGSVDAAAALISLKSLQEQLGQWHDSLELTKITAEALSHPKFLIEYPKSAALILRKVDRDNSVHLRRLHELLDLSAGTDRLSLESVERCCTQNLESLSDQERTVG